jgi:hypothetical protein
MTEWFLSLRGFDLIFAVVGMIGAACGVAVTLMIGLAKLTTGALDHDWRTCNHGCTDCVFKRKQSYARAQEKSNLQFREPTETKDHYISTARLDFGMRVRLNGLPYEVKRIRTNQKGYLVELVNLQTRMAVIATVVFDRADRKYWEPLRPW